MKRGEIVMVPLIYSMMFFSILAQIFHAPIGEVDIAIQLLDAEHCSPAAILYGNLQQYYWNKNTCI